MAARTTLAALARRHGVPYSVIWRLARGGGYLRPPVFPPELEERLHAALRELAELEGREVATHAS